MTRFDIPETVKVIINKAVEINVVDAVEVFTMATEIEEGDWSAVVDYIIECAYSSFHSESGRNKHSVIVTLAEKFWKEKFSA